MSSERSNISLTALYIGVPVLVGASCYYLYMSRNKTPSEDKTTKGQAKNKILSPLEQIMQIKHTGNQNFSRKNYLVAIEHYTRAIELSQTTPDLKPDDQAIFYKNHAACYEALSQYDEVISDCDKAIALKKNYIKAYLRRAKAYEKLENFDKAMLDAFSANLLEKFQNQSSMVLTDNIVRASSKLKAEAAIKTRKPIWPSNNAIMNYFSAFTLDPMKEYLKIDEIKTSEQLQSLLDEANKPENSENPFMLLVRGSCSSLMNDLEVAKNSFEKLLSLEDCPPSIKSNALIKKAALLIAEPSSGISQLDLELEKINELLDQASSVDPNNHDVYFHKAQTMALADKFEDALSALEKAIELKKDFFPAIAQKFYIEFKLAIRDGPSLTEIRGLLENFKTAVKENPNAPSLLQMYAQVLTEMSEYEQADQVLINLSKLDPSDGSVYVSRALLQYHLKSEPEEVATLLQEALKMDPKIIFAYEILGSIETQKGRTEEAIKLFETALKHAQAQHELEKCYGLLDSAKCQQAANQLLGMQV